MAYHTTPDIRVLCYPRSAIPKRTRSSFVVADVLGDRLGLGYGDSVGTTLEAQNPQAAPGWGVNLGPSDFYNQDKVQFVRFLKDGRFVEGVSQKEAEEVAGFIIEDREGFLDCKAGTTSLDTSYTDFHWDAVQGTWGTAYSGDSPRRCQIFNKGKDETAAIFSRGLVDANRSFRLDLQFSMLNPNGQIPGFSYGWGDEFVLYGEQGKAWQLWRKINGQYKVWRRMDRAPHCNFRGSKYTIRVRRIAGYLVIKIGNVAYWFLDTKSANNPPTSNTSTQGKSPKGKTIAWGAAKHGVICYNVRAKVGVALIKYANAADVPFVGQFSRHVPRRTNIDAGSGLTGNATGWSEDGTSAGVSASVSTLALDYTVTLTGSPHGIDTPFVNKILCKSEPVWDTPDMEPLDVSNCVVSCEVTKGQPPQQPGDEAKIDLDRNLLDAQFKDTFGAPNWQPYIKDRSPIEIQFRWRNSDGTNSAWVKTFKGYKAGITLGSTGPAQKNMSFMARDPIWRLQKENAVVNGKYPPLDFIVFDTFNSASGNIDPTNANIYASQCVREILSIALGPEEAAAMQTFLPADQYPIWSMSDDSCGFLQLQAALTSNAAPPTQNNFQFPPPFGDDVMSWISKMADYDKAVFFYGWPGNTEETDYPVPIYARILNYYGTRAALRIADDNYLSGDLNNLIQAAQWETRPDRDINTFEVCANGPGGNALEGIAPATRMAQARLPFGDPRAPEVTWETIKIFREEWGFQPDAAEALVTAIAALMTGVDMRWPNVTIRGNARAQWGDVVTFAMNDASMNLNNVSLRAAKVQHTYTNSGNGREFKTQIWMRPLTGYDW